MANEINISQLTDSIMNLYEIYQRIEVTDDITEENPAFDFVCDIAEGLYNSCIELMSLTYDHPDANPEMVKSYKNIIADLVEEPPVVDDDIYNDEEIPFY